MNIRIRAAEAADFEQIIRLIREFTSFEQRPEQMCNSVEKMTDEKEFFHCFIAETDAGEIIGYAAWFFCYYTWSGKAIHLDDLYVQPEYRGKGIGTKLIYKVLELGKANNCNRARWQVAKWNKPAIDFYQKLGAKINDVDWNCDLIL
ncbi:N-acetyltransferase [Bacteroidia bacterium]|nr:N-acetyltransferase [Bacteroidia bacterium]